MAAKYERLDIVPFGRQLLETADLDPVYIALQHCQLPQQQLARWLVAYWLFYSAGFASWASEREGLQYWAALDKAATNAQPTPFYSSWPRGSERRHFRGKVAVVAVQRLRLRYGNNIFGMLDYLASDNLDVRSVVARATEHYLFGVWIAFKVADMLDAVCGVTVKQDDLEIFLYDTPRASILEKWQAKQLPLKAKDEAAVLTEAMYWLQKQLNTCYIPHKPKQRPDWFTLETVWCKHHSHLHGHYPLYKDIREIRHGVRPWCEHSATAKSFLQGMPGEACTILSL